MYTFEVSAISLSTIVLGNALGEMYVCGSLRAVEKVKIYVEVPFVFKRPHVFKFSSPLKISRVTYVKYVIYAQIELKDYHL